MARTANIYARVEPTVKEQAELVFEQLGLPMSNAIGLFLKQVVLQRGLPFDVKLPQSKPTSYQALSDDEFNAIMEQGIKDYADGKTISAESFAEQMHKEFGI
jgi:DNA-damage-inducible protein J